MVPSNGSGGRHIVRLRASQQVVTKRRFVFAKLPTTGDDRFVVLGSWSAGLALTWVICHRLMAWTGLLPLFVNWFVCGIAVLALVTRLTDSVTGVRDRVAAAVVHAGALVLGIALLSAVLFIFVRGAKALPHLNKYVDDMAGVGSRDPFDKGVPGRGREHKT